MNKSQKKTIVAALLIIAAMMICPPYAHIPPKGAYWTVRSGYALIFELSGGETIRFGVLFSQVVAVAMAATGLFFCFKRPNG